MTPTAAGTRVPDDWFVDFHTGPAARFWRAVGAMTADADAALVAGLLDLPPGATVLDVPCGDGRIARRLAGLVVHGVDISGAEIDHARREGGATFAVGDMRRLSLDRAFDGLVSWGNSFGYLTPEDTARALAGFRRALRPGGRLVLESGTIAESMLVRGFSDERTLEVGGVRMTMRNRYDVTRSRLDGELTFEEPGKPPDVRLVTHHVHTAGEVVRMLGAAGFGSVDLCGPDGRAPYQVGDDRMIAVAVAA